MPRKSRPKSHPAGLDQAAATTKLKVDRKTKQLTFCKDAVFVYATSKRPTELADQEEELSKLLDLHLTQGKKVGKTIKCLEDRICLDKKSLFFKTKREDILYEQVEHCFSFSDKPAALMLCSKSENEGESQFTSLVFKKAESTKQVSVLILDACKNPSKKLDTGDNIAHAYSTMSVGSLHAKSASEVSLHHSVESLGDGNASAPDQHEAYNHQTSQNEEPPMDLEDHHTPEQHLEKSSEHSGTPDHQGESPIVLKSGRTVCSSPPTGTHMNWVDCLIDENGEDTMYFQNSPHSGIIVNEDGPIYMYSKRVPNSWNDMCQLNEFD